MDSIANNSGYIHYIQLKLSLKLTNISEKYKERDSNGDIIFLVANQPIEAHKDISIESSEKYEIQFEDFLLQTNRSWMKNEYQPKVSMNSLNFAMNAGAIIIRKHK